MSFFFLFTLCLQVFGFFFMKGYIKKLKWPQSTNQIHNKSFLRSFIISDVFFHFAKNVCFCCISKPIGVPSSCVPLLQKAVFLTSFEASVQLQGLSGSLLSACVMRLWLHQKVAQHNRSWSLERNGWCQGPQSTLSLFYLGLFFRLNAQQQLQSIRRAARRHLPVVIHPKGIQF